MEILRPVSYYRATQELQNGVESWELVQANLDAPLFARGTFCESLRIACTKPIAAELMNVSGL